MNFSSPLHTSLSNNPKPAQCRNTSFVKKVQAIVGDRLSDEQFDVSTLAVEANISITHLNRRFKKLLQCTPAAYIRALRMEHAATLLLQNNATVGEIAFTVGYANQPSFCRSFKRHYGCSPKAYSKRFGSVFFENGKKW